MEKVVNQDKLLNAGGTKKKATDLLAGHGISRPGKPPKNNKKETGKQKKRCASKDCKNFVKVHFHRFCDDCFSSRKEKSSADNESSALDDVPATVREQNHQRKLTSLKKKMAQMSSVRNKQKREALLQQANALLADMADALVKKNKKKDEEEHKAGLAELTVDAPATGELSIPATKPKPKKKKTVQDDELDRMLARCTVQHFAGCSAPSNYPLWLSPALQCAISSIDACIASVCSGLQLSLNEVVFAADVWNPVLDSTAKCDDLPMGPGTPPFILAQLVWGSVFIEYLSHFSLIPSRLTNAISAAYERHLRKPQNASFPNQYLQERGGGTTASLSSAISLADSSSTNKEQALVIIVPVGLPPELHQCASEYFLVVDSGATVHCL